MFLNVKGPVSPAPLSSSGRRWWLLWKFIFSRNCRRNPGVTLKLPFGIKCSTFPSSKRREWCWNSVTFLMRGKVESLISKLFWVLNSFLDSWCFNFRGTFKAAGKKKANMAGPRDNINAPQWRERELADGEICMKKSVWNWMWGRMYFTCNLYYILLIYALLLCFIVSEVVKSMAWLGYLQQKCLWIKFMEGSRRQSCSSLQVEIASGGIFFKRSLLCNQKSHTAQTHLKMITRARAINLKHM